MPSLQLICHQSEFKKQFKEKFKACYNIFTSESLKDGLRNIQKMDIDIMVLQVDPHRIKSYTWVEKLLRQKNVNLGEMCIILLIDPVYVQNSGFQKLLHMRKNFHFFWYTPSTFENADNFLIALELFLKNAEDQLYTLRSNTILTNKLNTLGQLPVLSPAEAVNRDIFQNQPVSFLAPVNTHQAFLETLHKSPHWPLTVLRGVEGLEQDHLARYIHQLGNSQNPFMSVDLGEIPEYFHESVLFGMKQKNLPGFKYINSSLFEAVKKGTLYIKNIEHLKWEVQNDFFRALQNQYFFRDEIKVGLKCRFILSSSVDLEKYVEKGLVRQDLYSHLAVYTLTIPTISQRKKDLPVLIDDYLRWYENKFHVKIDLSTEAKLQISKNPYPGQFDQFYNYLNRVFSLANATTIKPETLSLIDADGLSKASGTEPQKMDASSTGGASRFVRESKHDSKQLVFTELDEVKNLDYSLTEIEREYIKHVMAQNFNNIAESARILGITRKTLYDKLKKYKIKYPVKKTG